MEYKLTVGLEIHAELKTATKMFCACRNDADEKRPNVNICPVCMAHPGTLPVINKSAVHKVLLMGAAMGGTLADYTEFDRKNYFYPDIPKGYQISQYQHPLVSGGALAGVQLTRIHLEEDTARSQHVEDPDKGGKGGTSLVDYNRAGVPLMELVTEPVITSAEQAGVFAKELQLLLRTLGAGEANMEKGEMRVEANISVSRDGKLGTKVEVKNLNSFRSVERAIAYEFKRQSELIEKGGAVVQETRGWDEAGQKTFSQRKKESSHDYRYFPDPDLPKLLVSEIPEFNIEKLKAGLPELPWHKRERYLSLGLKKEDVEVYVRDEGFDHPVLSTSGVGSFFESCLIFCENDKELILMVSNFLKSDVPGVITKLMRETTPAGFTGSLTIGFPDAEQFVDLMRMFKSGEIGSRSAKDVLEEIIKNKGNARQIVKNKGLTQQSDTGALEAIARQVVGEHPGPAADFKGGKEAAMQFLVGQGMRASKGSANPQALREAIQKVLA